MSAITAPVRHVRWAAPAQVPTRRNAPTSSRTAPKYTPDSARPRLRVVGQASTSASVQRRHLAAWVAVMAVVFSGAVFGVVALNAMAAAEAVEAREIESNIAAGERRLNQLVAEVAALEEPARIRSLAEEAGMVSTSTVRFLAVQRPLAADRGFGTVFDQHTVQGIPSGIGSPDSRVPSVLGE